ncbi:MAG: hypothetical protein KC668_30265, partial [Myxococcales bacterium]|nr:hypothetical protein [Myxococcales bacterium]
MKKPALFTVLLSLALLASTRALAESAKLNLHVDLGVATALAGPLRTDYGRPPLGGVGWVSLDYQLRPPVALEVITGFGGLDRPQPNTMRGWSPYGTLGVGVRLRFMDNHEGYANEPGGDNLGNLWASAHLGYHFLDGHQFGFDAAVGYEWSLLRPMQVGVFLRAALTVAGEQSGVDGIVALGVNVSFELMGEVERVDTDRDGLSDEREVNRYRTSPTNPDTDGDELSDGVEVEGDTNPLSADTDGDGLPDGTEDANHNGRLD